MTPGDRSGCVQAGSLEQERSSWALWTGWASRGSRRELRRTLQKAMRSRIVVLVLRKSFVLAAATTLATTPFAQLEIAEDAKPQKQCSRILLLDPYMNSHNAEFLQMLLQRGATHIVDVRLNRQHKCSVGTQAYQNAIEAFNAAGKCYTCIDAACGDEGYSPKLKFSKLEFSKLNT